MNQDIQQILMEVRALNRRMDTLNTRLFGDPEGDAGDEGRLVVAERRLNNYSERISKLEQFRWHLLGSSSWQTYVFLCAFVLLPCSIALQRRGLVPWQPDSALASPTHHSSSDFFPALKHVHSYNSQKATVPLAAS